MQRVPHQRREFSAGGTTRVVLTAMAAVLCTALSAVAAPQKGIVSIGGDVTEIIYALGEADRVVAVDTTSTFPPEAMKSKASVGYMRALSAEGVLSVGGDRMIANEKAGPPEAVAALKASGLTVTLIDDDETERGVEEKINAVAAALGKSDAGSVLVKTVRAQFDALRSARAALSGPRKRVLFILVVRNGQAIIGGANTSASAVIELAGGQNAVTNVVGFKPLTDEAVLAIAPDVILTMHRGEGNSASIKAALTLPGIRATPAAKNDQIYEIDGQRLLGFGPRTPTAALDLMSKLYTSGVK
ncbi:MAG: ABC transporter substrate-binding protein [Pseudomonadota bacterium]